MTQSINRFYKNLGFHKWLIPLGCMFLLGCEGDYYIDYEWTGVNVLLTQNNGPYSEVTEADSISADVFGIQLNMTAVELSRSKGRYLDTEAPPTNINPLDSLIIRSLSDFDSAHKAGSNLSDLFYIINGNYLQTIPADGSEGYFVTNIYSPIFYDTPLVETIQLQLISRPDLNKNQQFIVEMILEDSTSFIDTTRIITLH